MMLSPKLSRLSILSKNQTAVLLRQRGPVLAMRPQIQILQQWSLLRFVQWVLTQRPHGRLKQVALPLSALLSFANTSQTGFMFYGLDNPLATEQGFRALVAYRGLVNADSAYNIYLQAGKGQANPAPTSPSTNPSPSTNSSTMQPTATLANTGDNGKNLLIATILLIICAGSGAALARRKYLNQQESLVR